MVTIPATVAAAVEIATETPVRFDPSPVTAVAARVPVTVTPVFVVSNFLELS